jgi:hypothetical protein
MRRIFLLSLLLASIVLCISYTIYWSILAHRLEAGLEPWARGRQAQGLSVRWESVAVSGFPVAFRLHFSQATVAGEKPLPFVLEAPRLEAVAPVFDLRQWQLAAAAGGAARLPGEGGGLTAGSLTGALRFEGAGADKLSMSAHDLAGNGAAAGLHIDGADIEISLADRLPVRDQSASMRLRLSQLTLPVALPPFGKEVQSLAMSVDLKGALPPGKLRDALATWRQDGGALEVSDGSLHWGSLAATANGTLALDERLQPAGALTATIENQDAIIDAAVANGGLRASDAGLVKIALRLLAKPGPDGKPRLTVPVRLQNSHLYLGPARIAPLPQLTWE